MTEEDVTGRNLLRPEDRDALTMGIQGKFMMMDALWEGLLWCWVWVGDVRKCKLNSDLYLMKPYSSCCFHVMIFPMNL